MVTAIKGITVKLNTMVQSGTDDFNQPVYTPQKIDVPNVLIEPASNDAIVSELEVNGKHISYILHIPKGDSNNWKDAVIELPEPWSISVKSYGDCLIYDENLTPLDWNKKIKVEMYE